MRGSAVTAHNCLNCPSDELIRLSVAKPLSGAADREAPPTPPVPPPASVMHHQAAAEQAQQLLLTPHPLASGALAVYQSPLYFSPRRPRELIFRIL